MDSVELESGGSDIDATDGTPGWNMCTDVEKVVVRDTRISQIEAFVKSPKCHVKRLTLDFPNKSSDIKKVMDTFAAASVSSLEFLDICCANLPANTFKMLAERNKSLKNLKLRLQELPREQGVLMGILTEITR